MHRIFLVGLLLFCIGAMAVTQVMEVDDDGRYIGGGVFASHVASSSDIGDVAIASTLAPGRAFELIAARVTVTDGGDETAVATSANLTITVDSASGAAYDHVLLSEDVELIGTGILVTYDPPVPFSGADELDIAYSAIAGDDDEILGVELVYRKVGAAP